MVNHLSVVKQQRERGPTPSPWSAPSPAFRIGPAFRNRAKPSERKPTARSRATARVPATSRACMCSNGIHLRGAHVCRALALSRTTMARTMQSASKSTGRKAPRKQLAVKRLVKIRERSSSRHRFQLIHPFRCTRRHLHCCALLPPHHRHRGQHPRHRGQHPCCLRHLYLRRRHHQLE